jgi:hypothetical protein
VLCFQLRKAVRLVSDAPDEVLAEQQAGRRDAAWVQEEVRKRYSAMNRPEVADGVKSFKGQMELLNPALVKGSFEQQVDVMRNMIMTVPEGLVGPIVGARLQNALIAPLKAPIVAGLQAVIDVQSRLTVAQVRQAIVDTSERKGRVNLVHPRLAAQKLCLRL